MHVRSPTGAVQVQPAPTGAVEMENVVETRHQLILLSLTERQEHTPSIPPCMLA